MKKLIAVLVIFLCVGSALSAIDMSAGGGGLFGLNFMTFTTKFLGVEVSVSDSYFFFGGWGFFDATYGEVAAEFTYGTNGIGADLGFGVYGKFPIDMGMFVLYPMAGAELTLLDYTGLWVRAGAGVDYDLSRTMFIRGELLYGIELYNSSDVEIAGEGWSTFQHGPKIRVAVGLRL